MCQPYTYRIKFIPTGQEYYGVRHGKKANPEGFWKIYFTSSRIVKELIREHGTEAFKVVSIKTHANVEAARKWEELFLISVNAARSERWLNKSNGGMRMCVTLESIKKTQEGRKKYYSEHPEALEAKREKMRRYHAEHPEAVKNSNLSGFYEQGGEVLRKFHSENPEARSKNMKEYLANNPEVKEAKADWLAKLRPEHTYSEHTDSWNINISIGMNAYYKENIEQVRQRLSAYWSDDLNRIKQSLAMATSHAKKANRPFSPICF